MEAQKTGISEDWLSLWLGLFIFVLGLGTFVGLDLLGWGIKTNVWTDITKALTPVSGTLKGMPGLTSLLLTYIFMLFVMEIGAVAMGINVGRFMLGFTLVFWIGYACWLTGHFAYIASTDAAKSRYRLVLETHRRSRFYRSSPRRSDCGQFLSQICRNPEGGHPARIIH